MKYFLFSLALTGMMISGCKHTRNAQKATTAAIPESPLEVCKRTAGTTPFNNLTLSGKAIADIPNLGNGISLSYKIQIERDKSILIKINKIIEIARVYITPTEITVLDKINRRAIVSGYAPAQQFTGLDADFGVVQDLLTGRFHPLADTLRLTQDSDTAKVLHGVRNGAAFDYRISGNCRLTEIAASNAARQQASTIAYRAIRDLGNALFVPAAGNIRVQAKDTARIEFLHGEMLSNLPDFSLSFSIPSGYEVQRK